MRHKQLLELVEKIIAGEIKHRPFDWASPIVDVHCPFDGHKLNWLYDNDDYILYGCPHCRKELTGSYLFGIEDAFKVVDGQDPYQGQLFFDEDFGSTYTKRMTQADIETYRTRYQQAQQEKGGNHDHVG